MPEQSGFLDHLCQYTEAIKLFLAINGMLLVITVGNALWIPLAPAPRAITMLNVLLLLSSMAVALALYYMCRRRAIQESGP